MDKHQSTWEFGLDLAQRQANEKQQAALIAELHALRRENADLRKVVEAARAVIDKNRAVTFDCSCLGGERCRMCAALKDWKLAKAALAPATSKETP